MDSTSLTLLQRLKQDLNDQDAWMAFVGRYGPAIVVWARGFCSSADEAEELTQVVLVKLTNRLRQFDYDQEKGTFRGWLRATATNTWRDIKNAERRTPNHVSLDEVGDESLSEAVKEQFDLEVLELARAYTREEVTDQTWEIFCAIADHGQESADIAKELGINLQAVYAAKSRVLTKLKNWVRRLETDA